MVIKSTARSILAKRTRRGLAFDYVRLKARVRSAMGARLPSPRMLHLGCGRRHVPHFLNVDVSGSEFDIDLGSGRLPWADGAFDAIVSQQVIEHLDLESQLIPLLKEANRVLTPTGEIWLACPDMRAICESYLRDGGKALLADRLSRWPDFELGPVPPSHIVNVLFHQAGEHVNLFDYELLSAILAQAGFVSIQRVRESDLLERFPGFPPRNDDAISLYVRAKRRAP